MFKRIVSSLFYTTISLAVISACFTIWLPIQHAFKIVFGAFALLIIPGFPWTYIFWKKDEIDLFERIILTIGISIVFTSLFLYVITRMNFSISFLTVLFSVVTPFVCGILIFALWTKFNNKTN